MGAVLHTLNIRLFPEQLVYIVNHAEDRVVIVDDSLVPVLAPVAPQLTTVEHFIVVGDGDASALEAGRQPCSATRSSSRRSSRATPGRSSTNAPPRRCATRAAPPAIPKGVVYRHRSTFLHSLGVGHGSAVALTDRDRVLLVVPMFHANAWGLPYAAWLAGADLLMPGRFLQAEPLARLIDEERPTFAAAVPTIWNELLRYAEAHEVDLSSLRVVVCGGSAVPRALMERFEERFGVRIIQAWGMTETSPLAAIAMAAEGRGARNHRGDGLRARRRDASSRASSCASSTTTARCCLGRRVGRRDRGARAVDHRGLLPRPVAATSSTTAGSAPATSAASRRTATSRSPTAPRT